MPRRILRSQVRSTPPGGLCMGCGVWCYTAYCDKCAPGVPRRISPDRDSSQRWNGLVLKFTSSQVLREHAGR